MSYVPATFTAGFALMLTAAGAVGGQWVSETFALDAETPKRAEVRTVTERPRPIARTVRQAELSLETPRLPHLQMAPLRVDAVLRSPDEQFEPVEPAPAGDIAGEYETAAADMTHDSPDN